MDVLPFPNLSAPRHFAHDTKSWRVTTRCPSLSFAPPASVCVSPILLSPRSTKPRASQPCIVFGQLSSASHLTWLSKVWTEKSRMDPAHLARQTISQFPCQADTLLLSLLREPPEAMLVNRTDAFKHALTHSLTGSVSRPLCHADCF